MKYYRSLPKLFGFISWPAPQGGMRFYFLYIYPIAKKAALALFLLLGACSALRPKQDMRFSHPGLLNSLPELSFMQKQIATGKDPWKSGYAKIPDFRGHLPKPVTKYRDGAGHSKDRYDINQQQLVGDAEAAYGSALHWFVTRDATHARKSIEILNAWANTLKQIDTRDDGSLSTSYGWPCLIYAAEIIRYTYPNWPLPDQTRFAGVLRNLVWPATQKAVDKDNGNNWRSLALHCRLAIAVYLDDRMLFEEQISALKQQIPHYIYANGQNLETPRDLWHAQMGMAPLAAAAEIAWHQGVDLYSVENNRLLTGVEWHAPFLMGETAGWPQEFSSTEKKYKGGPPPGKPSELWPFYELVYNHYHNRKGFALPHTLRLLNLRGRPEEWERTGGWGTATHSRHDLLKNNKVRR